MRIALTAGWGLVLLVAPVEATVLHVPSDVATIGGALEAASSSDTILVASGEYRVNLEWPDAPGISLRSESGPSETILDGGGRLQVVGFYTGVDTTTVLSGFTIRNGHAEGQ